MILEKLASILSMMVHAYNANTWGNEAKGLRVQTSLGYMVKA